MTTPPPQPDALQTSTIHVGRLRKAYELSVSDAEAMLNAVGGVYSTDETFRAVGGTHSMGETFRIPFGSYAGAAYSREKTKELMNALPPDFLANMMSGGTLGVLVAEAQRLSQDNGNYNKIWHTPSELHDFRNPVYWAIIDTCEVTLCAAVLYTNEILDRELKHDLPEITYELEKKIRLVYSLKGAVPAYYCLQYRKKISELGEDTHLGKKLRVYLYAAQDIMSNKEIAEAAGYSQNSIKKHINDGCELAVKYGLPPLSLPPHRLSRSKPKRKKNSVAG